MPRWPTPRVPCSTFLGRIGGVLNPIVTSSEPAPGSTFAGASPAKRRDACSLWHIAIDPQPWPSGPDDAKSSRNSPKLSRDRTGSLPEQPSVAAGRGRDLDSETDGPGAEIGRFHAGCEGRSAGYPRGVQRADPTRTELRLRSFVSADIDQRGPLPGRSRLQRRPVMEHIWDRWRPSEELCRLAISMTCRRSQPPAAKACTSPSPGSIRGFRPHRGRPSCCPDDDDLCAHHAGQISRVGPTALPRRQAGQLSRPREGPPRPERRARAGQVPASLTLHSLPIRSATPAAGRKKNATPMMA